MTTADPTHESPLPDELADLLRAQLTTEPLSLVNGRFVRLKTTFDPYGSLVVDITHVNFHGPSKTQRVRLMPTTPEDIDELPTVSPVNNGQVLGVGVMDVDDPGPAAA